MFWWNTTLIMMLIFVFLSMWATQCKNPSCFSIVLGRIILKMSLTMLAAMFGPLTVRFGSTCCGFELLTINRNDLSLLLESPFVRSQTYGAHCAETLGPCTYIHCILCACALVVHRLNQMLLNNCITQMLNFTCCKGRMAEGDVEICYSSLSTYVAEIHC